jgi:hypothetical protein
MLRWRLAGTEANMPHSRGGSRTAVWPAEIQARNRWSPFQNCLHIEPLVLHMKFLINLKGTFIHGGRQLFSPTFLVEVEGSLLK